MECQSIVVLRLIRPEGVLLERPRAERVKLGLTVSNIVSLKSSKRRHQKNKGLSPRETRPNSVAY
jgi:hypothetical protein